MLQELNVAKLSARLRFGSRRSISKSLTLLVRPVLPGML